MPSHRAAGVLSPRVRTTPTPQAPHPDLACAACRSEHVSVPDTGSLRGDLLELARTAATNSARPEVAAMARAVAAQAPHDAELAAANDAFWAERLALDGVIVERAIERGEVDAATDPTLVIEAVLGPIHLRLLLTGRPIDGTFLERTVDTVVNGVLTRPAHR